MFYKRLFLATLVIIGLSAGTALALENEPLTQLPVTRSSVPVNVRQRSEVSHCETHRKVCGLQTKVARKSGLVLSHGEAHQFARWVNRPVSPPTMVDGYSCVATDSDLPEGAIQVENTCWMGGFYNCVMNHENSARVINRFYGDGINISGPRGHTASGLFQIVRGTWGGYGGVTYAAEADAETQYGRAQELPRSAWHGTGCPGT